jgi:glycosyltransferase involved in cell wall biosynthesis
LYDFFYNRLPATSCAIHLFPILRLFLTNFNIGDVQRLEKKCFISSRSGYFDKEGNLWMDWANGRLISQLLNSYPSMSVAVFASPTKRNEYDVKIGALNSYRLPFPFSYWGGLINSLSLIRSIKRIQENHDLLIIQLPFIGFLSLFFVGKPVVYHICANVLTAAANPVKYKGIKRGFSTSFAFLMHSVYKRIFSKPNVKIITNGMELSQLYKRFRPRTVVSSSIRNKELLLLDDVESSDEIPLRLLFVGRPSLEKGFDTLVEAFLRLPDNFTLTTVGFFREDFERLLPRAYFKSLASHSRISFKGYLSWENGLQDVLRVSDVIVVPSRSEGTPRVILEAMSQRCAVLGSRIGGIPTIVSDGVNGLLVEPGLVDDIRAKIMMLSNDRNLREKLVVAGIETARQNTIEEFAQNFIKEIETLENV